MHDPEYISKNVVYPSPIILFPQIKNNHMMELQDVHLFSS